MEALACLAGLCISAFIGVPIYLVWLDWQKRQPNIPRLTVEQSDESLVVETPALDDTWPVLRIADTETQQADPLIRQLERRERERRNARLN